MAEQSTEEFPKVFKTGSLELYWTGHAGFKIRTQEGVIYLDPFMLKNGQEKADVIFISHSHPDHLDEASIKAVLKPETTVICSNDCKPLIANMTQMDRVISLFPGDEYIFGHLKILALPAYNLEKPFHPKEKQWLGFLIEVEKTKIYFSGDTDHLKELEKVKCDIGLFPVSGIYMMDPKEAAGLANAIKPKQVAIPMHWGLLLDDHNRLVGCLDDAKKFCELYKGKSQILSILS